jgi:hypothetical protein
MALEVSSGGAASDAGVPEGVLARKGTRLVYFWMYASRVTVVGSARKQKDTG